MKKNRRAAVQRHPTGLSTPLFKEQRDNIERSRPVGAYEIDDLADKLLSSVASGPAFLLARDIVNVASIRAQEWAYRELKAPEIHAKAEAFLETLRQIDTDLSEVLALDVDETLPRFQFLSSERTADSEAYRLLRIGIEVDVLLSDMRTLKDNLGAFLDSVSTVEAPNLRNARILERAFIKSLKAEFENRGLKAPRSKDGPFVTFACAAWRDTGFEVLDDIEDALGSLCERVDAESTPLEFGTIRSYRGT